MCSSFALVSSFNFSHAPLTCIQTASISSRSSYVGFHLDDSMQEIIKEIERLKLMKYRPEILDEISLQSSVEFSAHCCVMGYRCSCYCIYKSF